MFAAIGEILVDFTPVVESGKTVGFRMNPGGSPFNVAVGLARMGAVVEFVGKVSTDFFGRFLVKTIEREGIGLRLLSRSSAPSTLAFVALNDGEPEYSFYGDGAADASLRPDDLPGDIDEAAVLHFGSISLLRAPTSDTVVGLVERLAGRVLLSCDPNIRPGLISDPVAYRRLLERAFRAADIVKLSRRDLEWLMPGTSPDAAAETLLGLGPAMAVITLGANGCYAATAAVSTGAAALSVPVIDTVGAGDAFTAALLYRLVEQGYASGAALNAVPFAALQTALRFATAAAGLTCTRGGADPPRRQEIDAALQAWTPTAIDRSGRG